MNYRCPLCGTIQKKTKFGQSMVTRMEVECVQCHRLLRLNVHRAEAILVLLDFAAIITLALLAYRFQDRDLMLAAFGAAMLGAAALPLLERVCLRNWPRYRSAAADS